MFEGNDCAQRTLCVFVRIHMRVHACVNLCLSICIVDEYLWSYSSELRCKASCKPSASYCHVILRYSVTSVWLAQANLNSVWRLELCGALKANLNVVKSHCVIESIFSVCFLQFSAYMLLIVLLQCCVCVCAYARVHACCSAITFYPGSSQRCDTYPQFWIWACFCWFFSGAVGCVVMSQKTRQKKRKWNFASSSVGVNQGFSRQYCILIFNLLKSWFLILHIWKCVL